MSDEAARKRSEVATVGTLRHRALLWYAIGLAMLGFFIGSAAGLSQSPIVGVFLPLLFGLIGGGSGLYIAGADLGSGNVLRRVALLGQALVIFTLTTTIGSIYGISVRTGASLSDFLPSIASRGNTTASTTPAMEIGDIGVDSALELAALRYRLSSLGVLPADAQQILDRAKREASQPFTKETLVRAMTDISATASNVSQLFTEAVLAGLDAEQRRKADALHDAVRMVAVQFNSYAKEISERPDINLSAIAFTVERDLAELSEFIRNSTILYRGADEWLLGHDALRNGVWELDRTLRHEIYDLRAVSWQSGGRVAVEIDKLLASTGSSRESSGGAASDGGLHGPAFAVPQ